MRMIAGKLKGRRLSTPVDRSIRPTSDKVKEALFSMIAAYLTDAVVIDLFSGTGNLGLEAISRGAKKVYFGDKSRDSAALTKKNIQYCNVSDQSVVYQGEYDRVLAKIKEQADVIFLDPPYKAGLLIDCIEKIAERNLLAEDGIIAAEHGTKEKLPDVIAGYVKLKERKYGSISVSLYCIESAEDNLDEEI